MRFQLLERLEELSRRLGPLLDQLGVRAKVHSDSGGMTLTFEKDDGTARSPVELWLGRAAIAGEPQPGWQGTRLIEYVHLKNRIGHNGWTYDEFVAVEKSDKFNDNVDETFAAIEKALTTHDLLYLRNSHTTRTNDYGFVLVWNEIKSALSMTKKVTVLCSRDDGINSFNFQGTEDRKWKITVSDEAAVVSVDGHEIGKFEPWRFDEMRHFIRDNWTNRDQVTSPSPRR